METPGYNAPPPPPPPQMPTEPVQVVNPQFCVPYVVDLAITRKVLTVTDGTFSVTDTNGNLMFNIQGKVFSLRDRRTLMDAAGVPVLTLQQKIMTAHKRWQVYRGDSTDRKDLLFSVKKSHLIQLSTQLDVHLAATGKKDKCDFRVKGSYYQRSCTVYLGDTTTILAQMHKKHNVESIVFGKDTFAVTVYPDVDYCFIVGLIAVLAEINADCMGGSD